MYGKISMVKLVKILLSDFRNSDVFSLFIGALRFLILTILLGIVAFLTLVLFNVAQLGVSLPVLQWLFIFLLLGATIEVSVIGVFAVLYLLAFFVSAIYTFVTAIPVYIKDVKNKIHE